MPWPKLPTTDRCLILNSHESEQKLRRMSPGPGGGSRDRTDDPRLAKPVLSQLSYAPALDFLVGQVGIEPTTPALSRRCSNRLSY